MELFYPTKRLISNPAILFERWNYSPQPAKRLNRILAIPFSKDGIILPNSLKG